MESMDAFRDAPCRRTTLLSWCLGRFILQWQFPHSSLLAKRRHRVWPSSWRLVRAFRADTDRYLTCTAIDSHPISRWDRPHHWLCNLHSSDSQASGRATLPSLRKHEGHGVALAPLRVRCPYPGPEPEAFPDRVCRVCTTRRPLVSNPTMHGIYIFSSQNPQAL